MEALEKRFKFYQKSIFFSEFNTEQQKNHKEEHAKLEKKTHDSQLNNQTNKSILKGTPHNTPVILSPRVSHRPTTVNASLFDPKAHFIESAKHFKTETYLSRLLKTENNKKLNPKSVPTKESQMSEPPLRPQAYENIKIKQHVFGRYSSKSNSPIILTNNPSPSLRQQPQQHYEATIPQLNKSVASSSLSNSPKPAINYLKKPNKLSNDDITKYLTYRKKSNNMINTSKLITSLNKINNSKKNQTSNQEEANYKLNSTISDTIFKTLTVKEKHPEKLNIQVSN